VVLYLPFWHVVCRSSNTLYNTCSSAVETITSFAAATKNAPISGSASSWLLQASETPVDVGFHVRSFRDVQNISLIAILISAAPQVMKW